MVHARAPKHYRYPYEKVNRLFVLLGLTAPLAIALDLRRKSKCAAAELGGKHWARVLEEWVRHR